MNQNEDMKLWNNDIEKLDYLDMLFRRLKYRNNRLLEISNREQLLTEATIEDAFEFYISSFGLSFVKNIFLLQEDSIGQYMNMRCIIEGIAVYEYAKRDDSKRTQELLRAQSYIIERNMYRKYPDLDGKLINMQSISNNYEEAKKFFQDLSSEFKEKKLLNNRILFLRENSSYEKIVEEILGKPLAYIYKDLSLKIHPNSYINQNADKSDEILVFIVLSLLTNLFQKYPKYQEQGIYYEYDKSIGKNDFGSMLRRAVANQFDETKSLCRKLNEKQFTYLSLLIYEYSKMLFDFSLDILFGYSEHGTTKLKNLLELLGIINYINHHQNDHFFSFVDVHTKFMKHNNFEDIVEEDRVYLYQMYKNVYENGIDYDTFIKRSENTLGFLMDQNGNIPSLRELAFSVIDEHSSKINKGVIKNDEIEIRLSTYMKMKFEESQVMSHASGYMLFSTLGAWDDGVNIFHIMDDYFISIIEKIMTKNENLIKIQYLFRNYLKKYMKNAIIKKKIASIPRVKKTY